MRSIVVSEVRWSIKIGKTFCVARAENGDKLLELIWKIKGFSNSDIFERGKWKKTSDGMLIPSEITKWIALLTKKA